MLRFCVFVVSIVCLTGLLVAASSEQDIPEVTVSPAPQYDVTVYKLGGVQLPYVGYGALEYDSEEHEWLVEFAAPLGWDCTNLGWSFPAGEVPVSPPEDESFWRATGTLDTFVAEGVLYLTVWTENEIHDFEFVYSDKLADAEFNFPQAIDRLTSNGARDDPECPGGSCECGSKCKACCSEGYHPRCSCAGHGTCSCLRNKEADAAQAEPLELRHYESDTP